MTPKDTLPIEERHIQGLEEICENIRAIRRVANRILDHLHEYGYTGSDDHGYDQDTVSWDDMQDYDDMYM